MKQCLSQDPVSVAMYVASNIILAHRNRNLSLLNGKNKKDLITLLSHLHALKNSKNHLVLEKYAY